MWPESNKLATFLKFLVCQSSKIFHLMTEKGKKGNLWSSRQSYALCPVFEIRTPISSHLWFIIEVDWTPGAHSNMPALITINELFIVLSSNILIQHVSVLLSADGCAPAYLSFSCSQSCQLNWINKRQEALFVLQFDVKPQLCSMFSCSDTIC